MPYQIGGGSDCSDSCLYPIVSLPEECIDLSELVDGGYLPSVPIDPNESVASDDETRYYLVRNTNGTITVGSCLEELGSNSEMPEISAIK